MLGDTNQVTLAALDIWLKPRGKLRSSFTIDPDPMCPNVGLHLAPVPPVKPVLDDDLKIEVAWVIATGGTRK